MIIKVCGMLDADNIREVEAAGPDWMGFIFYDKSPRYVGEEPPSYLPSCKRVGVFVNSPAEYVLGKIDEFGLDMVQFHGSETPAFCEEIASLRPEVGIIKAFSIMDLSDIGRTSDYEGCVSYFLFDTMTKGYGGSGKQFDWSILSEYKGHVPFLLSGGIGPESENDIRKFSHPMWAGIDLNSRFETAPGVKDAKLIRSSILRLREMNRINNLFKTKDSKILSIYFCAGAPTLDSTVGIIKALESRGIDMIEIGIPFSDPMADGPVIQSAATKALGNGMSLKVLFSQLKDIRKDVKIPLILMGYLNPIIKFGFEAFCRKCKECGIDGLIIPDLPFKDYEEEFKPVADRYDIRIIMLITPETSDERIRFIDEHTDGFIYMVSSASTTGAQKSFDKAKQEYFNRVNSMNLHNPRMIGFGISNRQTLETSQANAAGAIIGSKFVSLLSESATPEEAVDRLLEALR